MFTVKFIKADGYTHVISAPHYSVSERETYKSIAVYPTLTTEKGIEYRLDTDTTEGSPESFVTCIIENNEGKTINLVRAAKVSKTNQTTCPEANYLNLLKQVVIRGSLPPSLYDEIKELVG